MYVLSTTVVVIKNLVALFFFLTIKITFYIALRSFFCKGHLNQSGDINISLAS